ncbi:dual specificity protein phosphatase family protein [Sphingomonas sp. GCM10030256]|uniref:protein-tyrosine phosphatase family protein n=1 Tax=Sphingomonas sp. GCM10030256 TaxID=3273427 RepID=UPI00362019F7
MRRSRTEVSLTLSPVAASILTEGWEPDIDWLADGLAVSGCFPMHYAPALAAEHGIGAVVDLREEDRDEHQALAQVGIAFLHLPTPDLHPATLDRLDHGVGFARRHLDAGRRVLIHCQHGIGRSPLLALCVMVDGGMTPLDALAQAKDRRLAVSPSESQYRGWAGWLRRHGHPVPSYHQFGCIAYRHLSTGG